MPQTVGEEDLSHVDETYIERLEALASAVGILLDGGADDLSYAMDHVISAYDEVQRFFAES